MSTYALEFLHELEYEDVPVQTLTFAKRCLLDLVGVAAVGSTTRLSRIIRNHATRHYSGTRNAASKLFFSDEICSPLGAALANGMTIDSIDAHDGHKLTKGHVGCGVLPALLAFTQAENNLDDKEFLTSLVIGYEMGLRAGIALHRTVDDYHTSGAWVTIACAAVGARQMRLSKQQTREAIGIAEYHGPRSQMMRVIDHPTMLKDGSGWGAMSGVSAAYLAADGFTGAPAITVEADEVRDLWSDIGMEWRIHEQYFKAYPVCRWAQPAVEAAVSLIKAHQLQSSDIDKISISTFHEAKRLSTQCPLTTEEAQYSLPFATALALVFGTIGPKEVSEDSLQNSEVLRLSKSTVLSECDEFNDAFPQKRFAQVSVITNTNRSYTSDITEALGDPEDPFSDEYIVNKYRSFTNPILGDSHANNIASCIQDLGTGDSINRLFEQIHTPLRCAVNP